MYRPLILLPTALYALMGFSCSNEGSSVAEPESAGPREVEGGRGDSETESEMTEDSASSKGIEGGSSPDPSDGAVGEVLEDNGEPSAQPDPDAGDAVPGLDERDGASTPETDTGVSIPAPDESDYECDAPAACGLVECAVPTGADEHVELCSDLPAGSNPPTSGFHYPNWAQFGVYEEPIPDGFFLHTLEHSAVALLYNCDQVEAAGNSCEELVEELLSLYNSFPDDPLCTDVPHRLVIAPDPDLDVPFAAAAWGYHLKGECFDAERVGEFIAAHYGNNYENLCNSGIDPDSAGCE